ncbi:tetratricopeptide repeat protein [Deinococcus soli (ex Cha et al. 2016)]|uniref:Tetratricopeptide (TPR) repeat protein n=2 Tax=Deinococcus soli (ex Cha et al. 2016) TaxID=1309411 RepID=A0ACC6KMS0_9DEIO|nr:tetratricopeptide repeat protein [Deinococcus soli (ex Cha et al. 2016)]MDR6221176.1 tetratricopeptide (TPR) repeat protein [Deinococcus soli (ex Cha et al. 2016)]MDR6331109.1 tetratricopeptide (TPR) repeat protein [Deinococcus soli (ex Cha et al. 2016)]MDR6753717.1 tetratricopeptide (TPR) repeat protein [Deinococcus soli (ex Cha et al. 2016)]
MPSPRRSSTAVPWEAWQASVLAFADAGRFDDAVLTLERALNEGQDAAALLTLLEYVEERAPAVLPRSVGGCLSRHGLRLKVRLTGNARTPADVVTLVQEAQADQLEDGFLFAHLAWALTQQEDFRGALQAAETALRDRDGLTNREQGLALRMKGFALNRLDPNSDWEGTFREALNVSEGWTRGMVLLDLGGLRSRAGNEPGAMLAYTDALELVVSTGHRAMLLNNMGVVCLRVGRFVEAEEYFMQVAGLKSTYRSRALSGQGATRRALGEWARAESLYQQAARASGDDDDLRQALRGLGYTQRLAGRHMQALETLRRAATTAQSDRDCRQSWVNVDVAATLVSLDVLDVQAVEDNLARTGPLDSEEAQRAVIVRAELARRTGQPEQAAALLGTLSRSALWTREEAHAFMPLFSLLATEQRPESLPRPQQTRVHLRALGVPGVQVNGRRIRLGHLELATLAALMLADGDLTTDELIEVIRDGDPRGTRTAAQRVSRVVRKLRDALGWDESVLSLGGAYQLDPAVDWTSDVQTALTGGQPILAFLSGVPLPWVTEEEQYLIMKHSDHQIKN